MDVVRRLLPVLPSVLLSVLLTVLVLGSGAGVASAGAPSLAVTGYALDGLPLETLDREAPALTTVGVDGVTLTENGAGVTSPSDAAYAVAARARKRGLGAELLVSNFFGDDFSPAVAHRLLSSPANRASVAATVAGYVGEGKFDGIAVDLESLRPADIDGLTAFVQQVRDDLPAGATMSIDLMASTTAAAYAREGGYDLEALSGIVDVVALMAYDQHGPWGNAGPVGSLTWQKKALDALVAGGVDASRIDLGVAGYGYYWPRRGTGGPVSARKARSWADSVGARKVWTTKTAEWSATLPNGTRLAWSDRRSWDRRVALAERRGLHGLALWRLGSADSIA